LGEFGFKSTTTPTGTLDGRIKLDGLHLDLVGTVPVNDRLSLLGRIGTHNARARDKFTSTGAVVVLNPNPEMRERNYKTGFGLAYQLNQSVTLRAELERYRINDAVGNRGDIDVATLSLVFPFGRTPKPAPKTVERVVYQDVPVVVVVAPLAPAPVAPVVVIAAPVVVPAVVAASPERLRVSFNADLLFGFDRASVSPSGMRALDQFTTDLADSAYDHITIAGHSDRIGTATYNEKLSWQRAYAVKSYLESRGVSTSNMTTVGKGSTEPALDAGACKRLRVSAALIACLGSDRRVDVNVWGSKSAKK
jgi:OmpA-OmpF porin, OOP family